MVPGGHGFEGILFNPREPPSLPDPHLKSSWWPIRARDPYKVSYQRGGCSKSCAQDPELRGGHSCAEGIKRERPGPGWEPRRGAGDSFMRLLLVMWGWGGGSAEIASRTSTRMFSERGWSLVGSGAGVMGDVLCALLLQWFSVPCTVAQNCWGLPGIALCR